MPVPCFRIVVAALLFLALAGCEHAALNSVDVPPPALYAPVVSRQQSYQPHPYQYLAPQPAYHTDWRPYAAAHPWKWIVIHHSDTKVGSAASFDRYHREVKHWESLGYHFVIGNGTGSRDGQIEVGPRWPAQKWGAHAGVKEYNEYGIGICLVGNFAVDHPSQAQLRSLAQLTAYLMRTYHIPADHVIGHRDAKHTDCPGRYLSVAAVRQMATHIASSPDPIPTPLASAELLHDRH
jgi:hypothetical protein